MSGESKVAIVREYLSEEFGSGRVTVDSQPAGMVFHIDSGQEQYDLTIVKDFLAAHEAGDIRGILGRWNVAGELRRADGLPMVVSEEGVRLASSN
jgi:hypothetical protein